ncbi:hypothetical protein M8J76_002648 [Diaphorina citri]|nr:hypothetical protein M8J76_002648 [Diaphorina citri]
MVESKRPLISSLGDSHLRWMGEELSTLLPSNQKVESFFQPGAGFKGVADVHTRSPHLMKPQANDSVVIYCGTNDVGRSEWNEIKAGLDILITKFKHCDRFCIIGVPLRFNTRKLNYHIVRFNTKLKNYVKSKVAHLLYIQPNNFINKKHYAMDGLHFNGLGKSRMCRKIANVLLGNMQSSASDINVPQPTESQARMLTNQVQKPRTIPPIIIESAESTFSEDVPHSSPMYDVTQTNLNSFLSKFYTDSGRENSMSDPFRYGSPIPVLEPGFNRPPPENCGTPGRDTGT